METVIDRGKRRKILNNVSLLKNHNKNPQSFLMTSTVQKNFLCHIYSKNMHMSNRIL